MHRIVHDFLLFDLNEEMDLHVNGIFIDQDLYG